MSSASYTRATAIIAVVSTYQGALAVILRTLLDEQVKIKNYNVTCYNR